ncbi:SMP-30/gluconolactonase/LRE family protein [bacterium]|nr:SMP-30/gluconolactonase/LRE family protein [bacterium]
MKKMELYVLGFFLFTSFCPALGQIDENYRGNVKNAFAASSIEECQSSLKFCSEVLKSVPHHPVINYLIARLNALLGNNKIAIQQLIKATKLGYTTKLLFNPIHHLNDPAFDTFRKENQFKEVLSILKQAEKSIHNAQIAFTINDKTLDPEGITYDPVEKMFYLGSLSKNKIIKVDQHGNSIDFIKEGQDGLKSVYGIHVDPIRRILWACSNSKSNRPEIFKYDLSSGKLIKKYALPVDSNIRQFNDLVIHTNGDIYISGNKSIYTIPYSSDKLELFLMEKLFAGLNGITLTEDEQTLYVADYLIGVYKVGLKSKSFSLLSNEPGFSLFGIDGLYFKNNILYAVQDAVNTIDRFILNKEGTHVNGCEVFERNSQYLHFPTTGVIVDDYFYFIADTQGKGEKGIIIMKTSLK